MKSVNVVQCVLSAWPGQVVILHEKSKDSHIHFISEHRLYKFSFNRYKNHTVLYSSSASSILIMFINSMKTVQYIYTYTQLLQYVNKTLYDFTHDVNREYKIGENFTAQN